ncbi:sigma-70 family RNA polymerase sigma factor [Brasilonema octagenarum UFV-E1]|uniref:Sigma-70 family RNA polymerase sigma factor n=1 Tax=Brasilonema sennae CENA114 TaxID=415709 RepID=A0A856M9L6_9CYAN|nr:sigma-70 family RNA polymerase sigma factor [Brasilonema sennae]QDL07448.1 sigma-70 family RNA polymerase sigma factor [Brasilonema sennae CENA114]QDL13810.1 sigma-70 family RNA polymerase sigma factor [Brasilonema octagenarum UFV-E1]
MRTRQEITDMFSTFAQLEGDKFSKWSIDKKLYKNIQNHLELSSEALKSENFWALYWHKHWRSKSNNFARMHLSAYLQEACYWTASKAVAKFTLSQYTLADYFQMAIAEVEIILKDFNSEKCSSLKTYAIMAIPSRLKDVLRQRKEANLCTNWALLRKVSKKLLSEALSEAGFSQSAIAQYRLAWTCFNQLYVQNQPGGTSKLPEPNRQLWEAIANLYNQQRQSQLTQLTEQRNAQTIEQWLNQTVLYVRAYLFPAVKSLNAFKQDDDTTVTFDLPDPSFDSPMADMIAQEDVQNRQNQISQMFAVLLKALQSLDGQSQEVLKLYYQQGLTQQQIMQQLQMSQPTVSRRLVKGRESMLAGLIKWSQALNICVDSNQIKDMSLALEEWLRNQYGEYNMNP